MTARSSTASIIDEEARRGLLGALGVVMTGAPPIVFRRGPGCENSTMRRRTVVRLAATLMFADRNRMTGIRRKVPLTRCASA